MRVATPTSVPAVAPPRPVLWRLPLFAFVAIGGLCTWYLDRALQREHLAVAEAQLAQSAAVLQASVRQRAAMLHTLRRLVEVSPTGIAESSPRFQLLAREMAHDAPDVLHLLRLDAGGTVVDAHAVHGSAGTHIGKRDAAREERAVSLGRAAGTRGVVLSATTLLDGGKPGVMMYDPLQRGPEVTGYVAAAFPYATLVASALGEPLRGELAYRLLDDQGTAVALESTFPDSPARSISRTVMLPGGGTWQLEIGLAAFQPFTSRLVVWLAGPLIIALVVLVVLREEQRAQRFAAHSLSMELLSHEILDANVRIEERARQVSEANRAKSRFLANVSHELRTPINAIVGYNALALEGLYGALAPSLAQAHGRIRLAADHLLGVVDDVLDLSKIESGRMDVDAEVVDLTSLLDGVVTVVDPVAAAKNVRLDVVIARDLPRLTSDAKHIHHVVLNLVANAVKFTERGSVCLIARRAAELPESHIEISVEDTGIGISPDDQERIFDEFEQVRPSGRGDSLQRGTGLGLPISRRLARLLGGEVSVDSRVGQGSRFTLLLPVSRAMIADTTGSSAAGPGATAIAPDAPDTKALDHADAAAPDDGDMAVRAASNGLDAPTGPG